MVVRGRRTCTHRSHVQWLFRGAVKQRFSATNQLQIVNETQGILKMIRSGVIRYSAFERFPEKIIVLDGMVVVMGYERVVPADGAPNAGKILQRRYTNIWAQHNGKWQLTIRHANNVCPG